MELKKSNLDTDRNNLSWKLCKISQKNFEISIHCEFYTTYSEVQSKATHLSGGKGLGVEHVFDFF